jgi:hypothetical protein
MAGGSVRITELNTSDREEDGLLGAATTIWRDHSAFLVNNCGLLVQTTCYTAGYKKRNSRCRIRRVVRRCVRANETSRTKVDTVNSLRDWGIDAEEIFTDGSFTTFRTMVQMMIGQSNRSAGGAIIKRDKKGNWSAIHTVKGEGESVHCSCFTVELMALMCSLALEVRTITLLRLRGANIVW